jgi:hypothetical protein
MSRMFALSRPYKNLPLSMQSFPWRTIHLRGTLAHPGLHHFLRGYTMARARITLLLSVLLLSCMVYPGKSWPLLEHLVGGDFDDFDGSMDNSKGTTKLDKRTWHIGVTPYTPGLPPQHGAGYTWPIFNPEHLPSFPAGHREMGPNLET